MKAEKLYLGNVITMDETKPRAKAICVYDGKIQYVGSEKVARSLCDENTEVIDLKDNTIYPGFLEAHCHPLGAGKVADTIAYCDVGEGKTMDEYVQLMKEFMDKYPSRRAYFGHGFLEREKKPTAAMLDEICPDRPMGISSIDAHSVWLNTKGLELFEINEEAIKFYGTDMIHVDENGNPTGYVSEAPAFQITAAIPVDMEDGVRFLKNAEQFFFSKGYTGVYDAGVQLVYRTCADFYQEAIKSANYKLRTYGGYLIDEHEEQVGQAVLKAVEAQKKYNNEYFKFIGVKIFTDGVVEAHTGLLIDDYCDQKGYKGVSRMGDHDKLVEIYETAANNDLSVHVHTVGDGAVRKNIDAIEEVAAKTGKMDQRYALAHLQLVNKDDIQRFADLNVTATVAPLWTPKHPDYFEQELNYIGRERAEAEYPIKSFVDAGANIVFHTDFPVSTEVSIPGAVYKALKRENPDYGDITVRKSNEFISRYQALKAMTINVAYMWKEENRMGSLEVGKIANMSVFDKDFLEDDIDEVYNSKLVCTIVDGDIVYKA